MQRLLGRGFKLPVFSAWGAAAMDLWFSDVARYIPIIILCEFALLLWFRRNRTHFKDFFNNFSNGVIHRYVNLLLWTPVYFALHYTVAHYSLFNIEISSVFHWALVLIATDFIYYWFHRALHSAPLLWALHDSHHSSPYVYWLSSFRLNWLIGGVRALSHLPLTLLGVNPEVTYFCYILVLVYQIFIHSEYLDTPHWFRWVFNSPDLHRVHHSRESDHLDKNFGGIFIFWDRWFGTFHPAQKATVKIQYGVPNHSGMRNPFYLNFAPIYWVFKEAYHARGFRQKLCCLFSFSEKEPSDQSMELGHQGITENS